MDTRLVVYGAIVCATSFFATLLLTMPSYELRTSSYQRVQFGWRTQLKQLRLPQIFVRFAEDEERRRRCDACNAAIPEMLDVLVLGLSAGLSFDMSLALYSSYFKNDLANLMRSTMMSWQLGMQTRSEALQELAVNLASQSFTSFVVAVEEALVFGSPLAAVLTRQAELCREQQRSLVEEQIEKAPVKILIPLATLIVPAMLFAILGPLVVATTQSL